MNKTKIYDIIFWISMLVIIVWIFLKMIGVIHSPVWIQLIPYAGAIFAAGSFYQLVRSMRLDLSYLKIKVSSLDKDMTEVKTDLKHVDSDLHYLKKKMK